MIGKATIDDAILKRLVSSIDARGPDYSSRFIELDSVCGVRLSLKSSVLHLRGSKLQKQPLSDCDENILLFNGQIYQFDGYPLHKDQSDTRFLSEKLNSCTTAKEIAICLSKITGPFAVIYWHKNLNHLFYCRDLFGRKSLCALIDTGQHPIILSSICCKQSGDDTSTWIEVDCSGIHCLDLGFSNRLKYTLFARDIDIVYHKTVKCQSRTTTDDAVLMIDLGQDLGALSKDVRSWTDFTKKDHNLALKDFENLLLESVKKRLEYNRPDCIICRSESSQESRNGCFHSKVAVAFSGGIDSTILALAIDKLTDHKETIDLVTVAFRDNAPDRISVQEAIIELIEVCPWRNWRLILCDIDKEGLQRERDSIIKHLIHPCDTVVDDSLGCACWFIGRAEGRAIDSCKVSQANSVSIYNDFCRYNPTAKPCIAIQGIEYHYRCPASMMFAGTGIDEQLGGYSSHRAGWTSSGIEGVVDEISFQMRRIWTRNMGRDDRVYSHHGRDLKLPYLDESLVSFLNRLPVGLKMDLSETLEVGPKLLIRELAVEWGLKKTSRRIKRALQFGTKIANFENAKEKGGDKCSRLISSV